ncbi:unnamed protein product [Brachionus calyciflorus]|uniref:F-box domain-containing protein n=1 Tax=Brachionus calyciflorus TaxID=104777 RepID=A0A813UT14_9BILA|nr:unnamed protein product [Brachionus calyciflorus]
MASILKLLQTVDPKTRQYIRFFKLSEIYESLISGLTIVRPDDYIQWLIEQLEVLQTNGIRDVKWDMFIPDELKPLQKPIDETTLSYIFNVLDEMLEPTPDMIEKAYNHYNKKLLIKVYYALRRYYVLRVLKKKSFENKMKLAVSYHTRKLNGHIFKEWLEWMRYRKDRQAIAYAKISRILIVSHSRLIIQQWHVASKEARQTREYFERQRLERGEAVDDSDTLFSNGEARDDISMLPRQAAIKIFSYLSITDLYRASRVCRSWKMIASSNILWSRLDLYSIKDKLTDKLISSIIQKSRPYLIHLNVRGAFKLTQNGFVTISGCRNIQDLNLSDCKNLNDDMVNIITTGCMVLIYLNLAFNDALTDSSIRSLSKNCKNLQYLSLAFCTKLTDKGFSYLNGGEGLKKLVYLDLSGCTHVTPVGTSYLAQFCSNLETIKINNFNGLNDRHMRFCNVLGRLTEIVILDSPNLTDESFKYIAQSKFLKKLKIASNKNITDQSLKAISKNCTELKYVSLIDCEKVNDICLKYLSQLRGLIVLNLADCIRISDMGIKYLADGSCANKVRELNLTNCLRIGNQSMISLVRKCTNLAYLSLCYCEQIEKDGIDLVGAIENLVSIDLSGCHCGDNSLKGIANPNLRNASFSGCKDITDLGLQKFCNQCPNLETLDLSDCYQLTDNSIKSLAFCCKFMMNLNLSGCTMLTDMSIQYLSGVCAYLKILDISNCHLIGDKSLKYLRRGCKYLETLVIMNCIGISKESIEKLQKNIPFIEHESKSHSSFSNSSYMFT